MATLVLGAVGTLVGGPLGGAIGSIVGRQLDSAIIGTGAREGPRLKDLALSTSTYGHPIARHFGQMRVPGTIIWSTDLVEDEETSSGGKGKPKTTTYSYSVSLAVALSSRPIEAVGRIWADGNLLRGSAGDLKTGGTMRFYSGRDDQAPDPLMQAALGLECPAYRGLSYVVFEDLQLADFGNRIPALTFETLDGSADVIADLVNLSGAATGGGLVIDGIKGISHEAGSYARNLAGLAPALPVAIDTSGPVPAVASAASVSRTATALPEAVAWPDGEFGTQSGAGRTGSETVETISELRYYDIARDYQPGLQRALAGAGEASRHTFELPGSFEAEDASRLAQSVSQRAIMQGERLAYRIAAIDETLFPGALVRLPDAPALWRIEGWEWRDGGVELELARQLPLDQADAVSASGIAWSPRDRLPGATVLRVFELPWDGTGPAFQRQIFAAATAHGGRWSGAQLYADQGGELVPLQTFVDRRAVIGELSKPLGKSPALIFEAAASMTVQLLDTEQDLQPVTDAQLTLGANRALVGREIIQFRDVAPLGDGKFVLTGLLRGRGATEAAALTGHAVGTAFTMLDRRLVQLDDALVDGAATVTALASDANEPAIATIENVGIAGAPLAPVHAEALWTDDGSLDLCWIRRARGAWRWFAQVDVPLMEEAERYEVGIGSPAAPLASFTTTVPRMTLSFDAVAGVAAGTPVWVRQIGDQARSAATLLTTIP